MNCPKCNTECIEEKRRYPMLKQCPVEGCTNEFSGWWKYCEEHREITLTCALPSCGKQFIRDRAYHNMHIRQAQQREPLRHPDDILAFCCQEHSAKMKRLGLKKATPNEKLLNLSFGIYDPSKERPVYYKPSYPIPWHHFEDPPIPGEALQVLVTEEMKARWKSPEFRERLSWR